MAFTFQTQSDYSEAGAPRERVQPGWYEATVLAASEKYSRGGQPMLELTLGVDVGRSKPFELKSWLVLSTRAAWKIEQFLAATGKKFRKGEQVSIDALTCEGKRLCVTLCNRETDKGGLWPDIMDFRAREYCPHLGAMTPEELASNKLNADGTRQGESVIKAFDEGLRDDEPSSPPAARKPYAPRSITPGTAARKQQPALDEPLPWESELEKDDIPF